MYSQFAQFFMMLGNVYVAHVDFDLSVVKESGPLYPIKMLLFPYPTGRKYTHLNFSATWTKINESTV